MRSGCCRPRCRSSCLRVILRIWSATSWPRNSTSPPSSSAYTEPRGYPPYHPGMMVALLLYAYSRGVYSSRRIARACEERLDFQAVTALNRPDFRTISEFR